jgi:alkaline phosphatase
MKHLVFLLSIGVYFLCCQSCKSPSGGEKVNGKPSGAVPSAYSTNSGELKRRPKNVIFLIGDGMGLSQISAGMYANGNVTAFERFPIVGLHKTHSSDSLITDSAAGATAFACGVKTYNYAIGVGPDKKPRPTLLELAEAQGRATGLVATSEITHATPASFIAHVVSRQSQELIALDFLKTDIDLFIGGGRNYFANRSDDLDLYAELRKKGYYVSDFVREPLEMMVLPNQPVAYFTANKAPLQANQGRDYLPVAADISLKFLDNRSPKGFFIMIEGSQIDWGGHANDYNYVISEMLDFDRTLNAVLDWAAKDGETLVVVTADHETGGMSLDQNYANVNGKPSMPAEMMYRNKSQTRDTIFTTPMHTATMIPVFAYGPGAEQFSGIYENTAIFDKLKALMGL